LGLRGCGGWVWGLGGLSPPPRLGGTVLPVTVYPRPAAPVCPWTRLPVHPFTPVPVCSAWCVRVLRFFCCVFLVVCFRLRRRRATRGRFFRIQRRPAARGRARSATAAVRVRSGQHPDRRAEQSEHGARSTLERNDAGPDGRAAVWGVSARRAAGIGMDASVGRRFGALPLSQRRRTRGSLQRKATEASVARAALAQARRSPAPTGDGGASNHT